jgi:5-methylcytosine-specific restriction endonuclease McrA
MSSTHDQPWRKSLAWKHLCRQVYAEESICWLCHQPVDFGLPPRTPRSRSVDHIKSVIDFPHLVLVRSNLRLAHYGCNSRRNARGNVNDYEPSREW